MAVVTFAGVRKMFGSTPAVAGLDLEIADGEFLVFVGPSGCGKTTSLRMLAGLESVTSGEIRVDGTDVTDVPAKARNMAMVFQNYALYPHMTVADNIGFALSLQRIATAERRRRVREAADMLEIGHLIDRRPRELSGGQRQRVAVARAIVRQPAVFLFDEPLSNLDAQLRASTRAEIRALQRRLGTTSVYVTHDQVEAMTMADRIVVMKGGHVQQIGTPAAVFDEPANTFVAGFVGNPGMNLFEAALVDGKVIASGVAIAAASPSGAAKVTVGIRPDALMISDADGLPGVVEHVELHGSESMMLVSGDGRRLLVRVPRREAPLPGTTIRLTWQDRDLHLFDAVSGARLTRDALHVSRQSAAQTS